MCVFFQKKTELSIEILPQISKLKSFFPLVLSCLYPFCSCANRNVNTYLCIYIFIYIFLMP